MLIANALQSYTFLLGKFSNDLGQVVSQELEGCLRGVLLHETVEDSIDQAEGRVHIEERME